MKPKKIAAQIEALKENLSKAEARLAAARSKADENEEARTRAAIDGRDLPPKDRRAVEDAEETVRVLTAALARAEAEHAAAVRDEEVSDLRARLISTGKEIARAEEAAVEALSQALEAMSLQQARANVALSTLYRLEKLAVPFDYPETLGARPEQLVERAGVRTWVGRSKTPAFRVEATFELHPGDFPA